MDHEKCYVFSHERPAKRRRVENDKSLDSSLPLRRKLYLDIWDQQRQRIDNVIKTANETTLEGITSFLRESQLDEAFDSLSAGFILAGPNISAHAIIFEQLQERNSDERSTIFITVSSSDTSNLKTLLKAIIKIGTSQRTTDEDELSLAPSKRSGRRLLDYDLELLHDFVQENNVKQIVVAVRDCEAVDSLVLSEAIELLFIWSNRIPFVLLFGIATSVENLQDRLSQSAVRCLAGQQFDVVQADEILELIFTTATINGSPTLRIGAQLSNMLLQRHHENLLSAQDFVDSIQYAYMSHFYANPLSVFMSKDIDLEDVSKEHIEALRNVPSFRKFAEESLRNGDAARELKVTLDSYEAMFQSTKDAVATVQQTLFYLSEVIEVARAINSQISRSKITSSTLYAKAMSGKLNDSPIVRELLLAVKKTPSDILTHVIQTIEGLMPEPHASDLWMLAERLHELIAEDDSGQPMRSEHDVRHDTMRTTVVAQKVQLSRHKTKLSEKDEAYSKIVTEFHELLTAMFKDIQNPLDLLGHEIVIYDFRMPHRAAVTPKPRFALERALSSPHDYLNCQCCGAAANGGIQGDETSMSTTLPPTALLYHLYLESGALINVSDLWSAYTAIMEGDGEDDVTKFMPLFQRALAELKYLGLVKPTRKKTDHISKVAWKGL